MKKFLFLLALLISLGFTTANAEKQWYRTTAYAQQFYSSYYGWGEWSKWSNSDMKICFDMDNDVITIYSPRIQVYRIYEALEAYYDNSGGKQVPFKFYDQDGDRGTLRLRVGPNGETQVYIDFADVRWVYNVKRVY